MTFTITVPDALATRLTRMPQAERDSLVTELLTETWDAEDDLREREEAAIRRGIADDEAGRFVTFTTFDAFRDECIARTHSRNNSSISAVS